MAAGLRRVSELLEGLSTISPDFINLAIESDPFRQDLQELTLHWAARRVDKQLLGIFQEGYYSVWTYREPELPSDFVNPEKDNPGLAQCVTPHHLMTRNFKSNVLKVMLCNSTPGFVTHTAFVRIGNMGDFCWDLYRLRVDAKPLLIEVGLSTRLNITPKSLK